MHKLVYWSHHLILGISIVVLAPETENNSYYVCHQHLVLY